MFEEKRARWRRVGAYRPERTIHPEDLFIAAVVLGSWVVGLLAWAGALSGKP